MGCCSYARQSRLVWTLGVSMNAYGFGGDSWKEEVLLHDGSTLIVNRSQSYGGRHEIGQPPPIKEHTITFTLPGSNKIITWTSEYGEDIGRTNFYLLAVHVMNGTPYIVASPNSCLSYNKLGSPNPSLHLLQIRWQGMVAYPVGRIPRRIQNYQCRSRHPGTRGKKPGQYRRCLVGEDQRIEPSYKTN